MCPQALQGKWRYAAALAPEVGISNFYKVWMEKNTAKLSVLPAAAGLLCLPSLTSSESVLGPRCSRSAFHSHQPLICRETTGKAFRSYFVNSRGIYMYVIIFGPTSSAPPHPELGLRVWGLLSWSWLVLLGHCQLCPGLMVISLLTKGNSELQCLTRESGREPTTV